MSGVEGKMEHTERSTHVLESGWTLWAHLPHDTDWSDKSYKKICTVQTIEEVIVLVEALPDE